MRNIDSVIRKGSVVLEGARNYHSKKKRRKENVKVQHVFSESPSPWVNVPRREGRILHHVNG
jgi:hypothetical protein